MYNLCLYIIIYHSTLYGFHITQETLNALSSLNNVKNM